jgi:hypothetical protein
VGVLPDQPQSLTVMMSIDVAPRLVADRSSVNDLARGHSRPLAEEASVDPALAGAWRLHQARRAPCGK